MTIRNAVIIALCGQAMALMIALGFLFDALTWSRNLSLLSTVAGQGTLVFFFFILFRKQAVS